MKIVLDTNVFVSGVFFRGPPAQILEAWRDGRLVPAVSASILEEYRRVGAVLSDRYEGADIEPLLTLLAIHSKLVDAPDLPEPVCEDPDQVPGVRSCRRGHGHRLRRPAPTETVRLERNSGSDAAAIRRAVPPPVANTRLELAR